MRQKLFLTFVIIAVLCGETALSQMLDRTPTRVQTTFKIPWKVTGSVRPRSVAEIPTTQNWTLGCETLCRDYIYWETYRDYVAPLGIRRIRLQGGWAKTEQERGVYDFKWLDDVIDDALSRGLEIWLETDYGNPIYPGGGGWDLGAGFPTSDEALAAWDRWVEQLALRYRGKVRDWAMWNEPDIGTQKTPEEIAMFNIRTAETILRIIPDARIGALSLARTDPKFTDQCLQVFEREGKMHLFTWLIYHGYAKNPDASYVNVKKLHQVVEKYDHRLLLWQGENGCPSETARCFALSNYPWTELTQAKWDARRMLGDLGHDVVSSVFTICDFDHKGREINRKGLLKINNKRSLAKVKTAYYTVQNIVSIFDGTLVRVPDFTCQLTCGEEPVVWFAYRDAEAENAHVLVFWNAKEHPQDDNAHQLATVSVPEWTFRNPVYVDIVTGNVYEIPQTEVRTEDGHQIFTNVPVYDAPTLIAERVKVPTL